MSTSWSTTAGNAALSTLLGTYVWVKLHVGDPGSAATANPATNTVRVQVTWGSVVGGTASNSAMIQWTNVAASEDYTHFSVWSASSGGTFGFSGTITANPVTTGDTFTIAIGDLDVALTLAA